MAVRVVHDVGEAETLEDLDDLVGHHGFAADEPATNAAPAPMRSEIA